MTLRKKLILILLAVAICPMIFVGTLGYFSARKSLGNLRLEALQSITDQKAKMIEDFFSDQKNHVQIAQQRPTIKKYSAILSGPEVDFSSPVYEIIREALDRALKIYLPVYDYANVMLANPQGRIVYVLNRYSGLEDIDRILPELWPEAFKEGRKGVNISHVFRSRSQAGRYSVYITAPVHDFDGKFVGVIALEFDMAPIFKLVQNLTGMGETGETVIARKEDDAALFLNPLRYDPDAALKRRAVFGRSQAVPMQEALKGKVGHGFSIDYRGQKVIAVWRYMPLLDWGIVAKIDVSEAYEPATTLRDFVLVLVVAVITLSIFLAVIAAKSISDPIQILQKSTEEIGRGNLDFKVGTDAKDEIGQLGRAFDQMTAKLKAITASRDELDREVNERKKAEKALRLMKFSIDHSSEMLYWIDPDGNIVDVNDTTCTRLGYSRAEIVSIRVDDIDPNISIEDYHQIWQDLKGRGSSKVQTFHHPKDGQRIPVEITLNYIQFGGKEYNCAFARDISERKQAEEELQKSMSELDERVKELNCLFEISRLVEKRNLTLDGLIQGIIDLIPPAWQYPDITCAKINFKGQAVKTSNFKETIWQQTRDIIVHGVQIGNLAVGLLEERPERDEGPFLPEERALLDAIAERVGRIIERRWAQEEMYKSEEKFRELMENMHSGVAVYEPVGGGEDFEVKDFNRSGEEIENVDRDKVIGRRVTDVFPGVKNSGLFDVLQRVWQSGIPEHFSGGVYQDHRTPPSWRENYVYKLSSGEIVAVYQDVTREKLAQKALEESEKRFRDLVENSHTGISIIQDNQVVYQNQEQERLIGPLPRSYLLADFEKIHPDDVETVTRLSQRIDRGEIQTLETEFRFYSHGTSKNARDMKWVYCRALSIDYRGKKAILFNMIDMTQAKEMEKLLAIQDKMASLGRVAAGIAHEIRNPLSGINIYLNTLKKLHHKKGSEEKVKQILAQIQSASHKIESVIRRVMDFAKPGEPRLALIDLNQPIAEALNLSAVTMRKSGVELERALSEGLPLCKADAALIEEMALNILNNAAEAMKTMEAGKKIVVTSNLADERIILTFSDSGPGIAPDVKDKIFDPYFTTKSDGTGIGLSLSHRIVTDHGGSLTVADSNLGGAEFRIIIPIKR
ncbi:PAS domain S-box protein [Thermodesulfobacteriota bacterium]